ncbi:MAG: acyltransferase family protein [Aquabacterium sp.]
MNGRCLTIDVLKLAMAFMVVGLHAHFLNDLSPLGGYLTVEGLFRIAVPIFLLINGYYFYAATDKGEQYVLIKRLFILYVFWMLAYLYIWLPPPTLSAAWLKKMFLISFFGYFHLWYIAGLIGAMLVFLAVRRLPTAVLLLSAIAMFLAGVFIQYEGNYDLLGKEKLHHFFVQNWAHRNFLFFSYPFFCVGYLIRKYRIQERLSMAYAALLGLTGLAALLAESYFNYTRSNDSLKFDNYLTLMLACPALFLLCLKIDIRGHDKRIALYSSSVYFVHIFFLVALGALTHDRLGATPLTGIVIALSLITSYFVIRLNKRVKFIL